MLGWPWPSAIHAGRAFAQPRLSRETYEKRRLDLFLNAARLTRASQPEGKRISYIRFERREVFEPDDLLVPLILPRFASTWPNAFHAVTREDRLRSELLLKVGERYSQRLLEESLRNLRDLELLALATGVAVTTDDPAAVGLIIYTRDLWSLRLQQSFAGAGKTFAVSGQLVERNFLGRGEALAARGSVDPLRFSAGEAFSSARFLGHPVSVYESFDLIWRRETARLEGSTGTFKVARPFYNLAQRTAYTLYAAYADYVYRDTRAGEVVGYNLAGPQPGGNCMIGSDQCLARVWRDQSWRLELSADYRIGERYKQTSTLGLALLARQVHPTAETALSPEQRPIFEREVLPKVRRDIYPFARYRLSLPDYVVMTNLATFGLSESIRRGPNVDGMIGLPLRAYGASSDGLVLHGVLGYTWAEADALLDGVAEGFARLDDGRVFDQRLILRLRGATPAWPWLVGRVVFRAVWDMRQNDTQRSFVSLGGENGLRGYPAQQFYTFGGRKLLGTLEYRSLPWLLESVHVGMALFYDVGSVYQRLEQARIHHCAGAGLRVLLPQLNRTVFRVDAGVPLDAAGFTVLLTYGSEQYVPLTEDEDLVLAAQQAASVRQGL